MSHKLDVEFDPSCEPDRTLLDEFSRMWAEADELWEQEYDAPAFQGYVSADYMAVCQSLARLRGSVSTVLEWGSGLGIVTIMAARLGFEAYGIEAESGLIEYAETFARAFGANAQFAQGNFIPDDYEWNPAGGDEVWRTIMDTASAYDELGMDLEDFDLIYAFPWPDELTLFHNIVREHGHRNAMMLSYDAREGIELVRFNDR